MAPNAKQTSVIENIHEFANIDSHIKFLDSLLGKYEWETEIKKKVSEALAFIRRKRDDKNLNLSIIGEFASGKSTFINALLRDNLLESSVLQGTTTAPTIIRYAPDFSVQVNYKDGRQELFCRGDGRGLTREALKERIKELTTNGSLAAKIKEVIIGHPAAILQGGISIIDTPGTNSIERWHEDVTKEVIREISDVSIILTTADKPMPHTLNSFIHQNLGDILGNCIFVVTKMDMVREREQQSQLDYIKQKIKEEFGIKEPVVYPYSPLIVLGETDPDVREDIDYGGKNAAALVEQSYQTEKLIYQKLLERRIIIQCTVLLSLIRDALSVLQQKMKDRIEENQKKILEIEAAKIRDVDAYIQDLLRNAQNGYQEESNSGKAMAMSKLDEMLNDNRSNLLSIYDRLLTRETVTGFVRALPERLKKIASEQLTEVFSIMNEFQCSIANNHFQKAFESFKQRYTRLAITSDNVSLALNSIDVDLNLKLDITYKEETEKALSNEKILSDVSKYVPIVEAFAGFYNKFKFNSIKEDYRNKIITLMNSFRTASCNQFEKAYDRCDKTVISQIRQSLYLLKAKYDDLIEAVNKNDQIRQQELTAYCSEIERSLAELRTRSNNINSVLEHITKM